MRSIFRHFDQIRLPILSLIVGCLVACSIDWPTPIVVQKDATIAFPCQTRGCGCKNASQCWKSCCCFSDAEKLAWANANGVMPPSWFMEKMSGAKAEKQASKHAVSAQASVAKQSSCCCCCKSKATSCSPAIDKPVSESNKVVVHLTVKQQRGCNGQLDYQLQHLVYLPIELPIELPQPQFPHFATPAAILTPVLLDLASPPPRDFWIA